MRVEWEQEFEQLTISLRNGKQVDVDLLCLLTAIDGELESVSVNGPDHNWIPLNSHDPADSVLFKPITQHFQRYPEDIPNDPSSEQPYNEAA